MFERVVVTGLGAVTPLGNDVPTYWAGLVAGRSGVGPIAAYDASGEAVRIAAEIKDLDVAGLLGPKRARRTDSFTQAALIAADQAVDDAGLDFENPDTSRNAAVVLGTAVGGITTSIPPSTMRPPIRTAIWTMCLTGRGRHTPTRHCPTRLALVGTMARLSLRPGRASRLAA